MHAPLPLACYMCISLLAFLFIGSVYQIFTTNGPLFQLMLCCCPHFPPSHLSGGHPLPETHGKAIGAGLFILIIFVAALAFLKWWFTYVEKQGKQKTPSWSTYTNMY